ncbi:MAG TPA: bacterial transcriptional activator domain-containing protein, partial [Oscillatoriaceae cyanobacterium]
RALGALYWLVQHHRERADLSGAERLLKRAIALAPCEEEAYISLMRLQDALGHPERIRQIYWDCRKALKANLGMEPSEAFEDAYKAIAAR